MSFSSQPSPWERLLDPLVAGLNAEAARYLAAFRADAEVQQRIAWLAEKSNEGELSSSEQLEYEAYVKAATFISVLQSKARKRIRLEVPRNES